MPKRGRKGRPGGRLYTPQEIVAYYQEKGELPPELRRRVGK